MSFDLTDQEVLEISENPQSMMKRIGAIKYNTILSEDPEYFQRYANSSYLARRYNKDVADVLENYDTFSQGVGYTGVPSQDKQFIVEELRRQAELKERDRTAKTVSEGIAGAAKVGAGQLTQNMIMMGLQDPVAKMEVPARLKAIESRQAEMARYPEGSAMRKQMEVLNERDAKLVSGFTLLKATEIRNFVQAQEKIEAAILSKGFADFQETGKIPTGPKAFGEFISGLLVSQTVAQSPTIAKTLASGPAAPIAVFADTLQTERSNEIIAHFRESGVDLNSEDSLRSAISNESLVNQAVSRGTRKAFPVAIAAFLSSLPGAPVSGVFRKAAVESGSQAGFDALGEGVGQVAATGTINPTDLFVEVISGMAQNAAEASTKLTSSLLSKNFSKLASTPDGKPMTEVDWKTQAESITNEEVSGLLDGLYDRDLVLAARGGDKVAQQVAAEIVQTQTAPKQEAVYFKQAEIEKLRETLNLYALDPANRVAFESQLAEAKRLGLDNEAESLANRVIQNPRPITAAEEAGMNLKAAQLKNQYDAQIEKANAAAESGDTEANISANDAAASTLERIEVLSRASKLSGTEIGRALAQRRVGVNVEDYSLASMVMRAQAAKGDKLTDLERGIFEDLSKKIASSDKKIKELEDKLATLFDEKASSDLKQKILEEYVRNQQVKRSAKKKVDQFRKKTKLEYAMDVAGLPRALIATADMSATLRQGLLLSVSRPTAAVNAFVNSFQAFFSQNKADEIDLAIKKHPDHYKRERAGLYLTPMDRIDLAAREETFVSSIAERIPLIRHLVLASERHMVATLNMLRASAFDQFLASHPEGTISLADQRAFADYVNKASGRGNLGKAAGAAQAASIVFFAPRFAISRFQAPMTLVQNWRSPVVRNAIAKDFAVFALGGSTILLLASLAGFDVSWDPEDSDFGKIKIGDTRVDIWGSFQQPARLALQPFLAGKQRFVEGETDIDLVDAAMRFTSYKLNPAVTIPAQLLTGRDLIGEDRTVLQTIGDASVPLIIQETLDTLEQENSFIAAGGAFGGAFFGIGVSSFNKDGEDSIEY